MSFSKRELSDFAVMGKPPDARDYDRARGKRKDK
jgi:hypothetical protein